MTVLKKIGIIANLEKAESPGIVHRVIEIEEKLGWLCLTDQMTYPCCSNIVSECIPTAAALAVRVDLLVVIGGDGTILRVARSVAGNGTPLLGIKTGRLGFLTQITTDEMETAIKRLAQGNFELETRSLLSCSGKIGNMSICEIALNDFVLSRGVKSRIIDLHIWVDNQFIAKYLCDGLIISTPTGSTAYSLAAGGGIITPNAEVFSITPICPHSFQNRTVIVNDTSIIRVDAVTEKLQTILAADGQVHFAMNAGDSVQFKKSVKTIQLVRFKGDSFFNTLRSKLNWLD